jgi:hypothetical protein
MSLRNNDIVLCLLPTNTCIHTFRIWTGHTNQTKELTKHLRHSLTRLDRSSKITLHQWQQNAHLTTMTSSFQASSRSSSRLDVAASREESDIRAPSVSLLASHPPAQCSAAGMRTKRRRAAYAGKRHGQGISRSQIVLAICKQPVPGGFLDSPSPQQV